MKQMKRQSFFERFFVLVIFVLVAPGITHCLSLCNQLGDSPSCGLDPKGERAYLPWDMPQVPGCRLVSIFKRDMGSIIFVSRYDANSKPQIRGYLSTDHGGTWLQEETPSNHLSNINFFPFNRSRMYAGIRDNQNPDVCWRSRSLTSIAISLNRGELWEEISPVINRGGKIERIDLIGVGKHDIGRLYAGINVVGRDYAVCRSDDYGRTFSVISSEVLYAVESRADRDLMIGVDRGDENLHRSIMVSRDGGKTWNRTISDIVVDKVGNQPRNNRPVRQIESDPQDPDTFYVLTWTGIYATRDWGKTFRLLPLAAEYLYGVDSIAVDPVDNRYIYAVVKGSNLYRSSDKGCTWEKLQSPL
jgi:hypothetical protein